MMIPGAFAELVLLATTLGHLGSGLLIGGLFSLPSLLVRWRGGGRLVAALAMSQVPSLLAASPSLLGALLCVAALLLCLAGLGSDARQMFESLSLLSLLVPPLPGLALGIVGLVLLRRVATEEGGA